MKALRYSSASKALYGMNVCQNLLKEGWTTIRIAGDGDVFYAAMDIKSAIQLGLFVGPRLCGAAHCEENFNFSNCNSETNAKNRSLNHRGWRRHQLYRTRTMRHYSWFKIDLSPNFYNKLSKKTDGKIVNGPEEIRKAVREG